MGRSGGRKLLKKKGEQLRLFDTNSYSKTRSFKTPVSPKPYIPGPDHDEMVLDATLVWVRESASLLDPEQALLRWREKNLELRRAENHSKNNIDYWRRAHDAFIFEVQNSSPGPGTFFRGQSFRSDHPFNRARSWTKSIDAACYFAFKKPHIVGDDDSRVSPRSLYTLINKAKAGEEVLSPGERLAVSAYVIHDPLHGLDLNHAQEDARRDMLIEKAEKGEPVFVHVKEGDEWQALNISFTNARKRIAERSFEKLGFDGVSKSLGIGVYVSENSLRKKINEADGDGIEKLLKDVNDSDLSDFWEAEKKRAVSEIKSYQVIHPSSFLAEEEEIVLIPSRSDNIRRVEITIARSNDDLKNLNDDLARDLFKDGIENLQGSDASVIDAKQLPLFWEDDPEPV